MSVNGHNGQRAEAERRSASIEPLTDRERSLLDYLPTHLTYAQIGSELFLSVNTVKSNLKNVYRKLGVRSRAEAVAVAREAGLVTVDLPISSVHAVERRR